MNVCVLGLGRVGLPLALLLAREHSVVGVDIDGDRVEALNRGSLPVDEPAFADVFDGVRDDFEARTDVVPADAFVIVTPTPLDPNTDIADLSYVGAAGETVASVLSAEDLVVLASTVPPGTTDGFLRRILEQSGLDAGTFHLAHCPERAIPGNAIEEMVNNSRLIGGIDDASTERAAELFGAFVDGEIHRTTPRLAELVKLMENTFRDTNIALANEFAKIAEELGVDVHRGIELANEHPRVDVHRPGPGVGGHCITIDPLFLAQSSTHDRLISVAREINESMAKHVAGAVRDTLDPDRRATVTLLGAAYKGDVSDTRETPARPIARLLRNLGHEVRVYDPHVEAFEIDPVSLDRATADSDCLVVVTDHSEFEDLDPGRIADGVRRRTIVDTRAIIDRERWEAAGFDVAVLGDGRPRGHTPE
jgi:UDP-N-acetyl-D-mannosaminuronic acid dehydrogenase